MNIVGDWRYVSSEDIKSFGSLESRKAAFSSGGAWHNWILNHDAIVKVEDTLFMHGGLSQNFAEKSIAQLNTEIQSSLITNPRAEILGSEGPLWYRGYLQNEEKKACEELDKVLALQKASRMVVGHTTQRDGKIKSRCAGKLIAIDVGLSAHYGANQAILKIENGDAKAIYSKEMIDLPDPTR